MREQTAGSFGCSTVIETKIRVNRLRPVESSFSLLEFSISVSNSSAPIWRSRNCGLKRYGNLA